MLLSYRFRVALALIGTALCSLPFCSATWAQDGSDASNEPSPEVTRKVMGDDIPSFRSVWGLSSLTDEQREQLKPMMENFQAEAKPMIDELDAIRSTALKGGSLTSEQMQEASQMIMSGNMPNTSPAESKVLSRVQELKDGLKEKRAEAWQQIKNVLTAEQINEVQNF